METLLTWFKENNIILDERLEITTSEEKGTFIKAKSNIPSKVAVAQIPKRSILSRQNSSLNHRIQQELPVELSASLVLSICLLHETLLGSQSRWSTYIEYLPIQMVPIASLWSMEARKSITGTDLDQELRRLTIDNYSLETTYTTLVLPFFSSSTSPQFPYTIPPSLSLFIWSYSIVSSRAFQVDSYHSLSLVPLADLFNHSDLNQVHFASDLWVCGQCGSFDVCVHDGDDESSRLQDDSVVGQKNEDDDTCEIYSNSSILEGEEVFNTYGLLSNAKLLASYGFMLEANEFDRCSFSFEDVVKLGKRVVNFEEWKSMLNLWTSKDLELDFVSSSGNIEDIYFDADAKLSIGLWLLIALSSLEDLSSKDEVKYQQLFELAQVQDQLFIVEEVQGVSNSQAFAEVVVKLCQARKSLLFRPDLNGSEIFLLAESIKDISVKMAMEFAASERVLLECVQSQFNSFV